MNWLERFRIRRRIKALKVEAWIHAREALAKKLIAPGASDYNSRLSLSYLKQAQALEDVLERHRLGLPETSESTFAEFEDSQKGRL